MARIKQKLEANPGEIPCRSGRVPIRRRHSRIRSKQPGQGQTCSTVSRFQDCFSRHWRSNYFILERLSECRIEGILEHRPWDEQLHWKDWPKHNARIKQDWGLTGHWWLNWWWSLADSSSSVREWRAKGSNFPLSHIFCHCDNKVGLLSFRIICVVGLTVNHWWTRSICSLPQCKDATLMWGWYTSTFICWHLPGEHPTLSSNPSCSWALCILMFCTLASVLTKSNPIVSA